MVRFFLVLLARLWLVGAQVVPDVGTLTTFAGSMGVAGSTDGIGRSAGL